MAVKIIEDSAAKSLTRKEKWEMLSPFLKQFGHESLAYATLQDGMEYFVDDLGYIAYTSMRHPVFARKGRCITLSDPVCAPENLEKLVKKFLQHRPHAAFCVISETCAETLQTLGFKVNCIGFEPEIPIQTYNTNGNWKELDLIKRARNEAKREGIVIREEAVEKIDHKALEEISKRWIGAKIVNDREIWIYARRPVFEHEEDVRKFIAYDKEGRVAGFVFYDPMYRDGKIYGYSANISRCDEQRYGKLATAVNMTAAEIFKSEGKEILSLLLAPFMKLETGKYNDDWMTKMFLKLSVRYGNDIYNFNGLAFHKSKYRGNDKPLYFASNSLMPSNDVYLAFLSADIATGYFSTWGRLFRGMFAAKRNGKTE